MTTININLLPEELRAKSSGGAGDMPPKEALVPIGIGAAVAVAVAAIPYAMNTFWLEPRALAAQTAQEEIDQEINKYNTTLNSLKAIADKKELLRAQLSTLQSVAGGRMPWAEMLNELRALTPGNLWYESLKIDDKDKLSITGTALDYSSVAFFHRNLQNSDHFYNPVLSQTAMAQGQNGISTVSFTMDVTLRRKKS